MEIDSLEPPAWLGPSAAERRVPAPETALHSSALFQELVVVRMSTDPNPKQHLCRSFHCQGTVFKPDAY